jgi:hypothetical protein
MYDFLKTQKGWLVFWGPAPVLTSKAVAVPSTVARYEGVAPKRVPFRQVEREARTARTPELVSVA